MLAGSRLVQRTRRTEFWFASGRTANRGGTWPAGGSGPIGSSTKRREAGSLRRRPIPRRPQSVRAGAGDRTLGAAAGRGADPADMRRLWARTGPTQRSREAPGASRLVCIAGAKPPCLQTTLPVRGRPEREASRTIVHYPCRIRSTPGRAAGPVRRGRRYAGPGQRQACR
jgi:hypothetical protein